MARNYWVVSPNVRNNAEEQEWKKFLSSHPFSCIGWEEADPKGNIFIHKIKKGDVIINAQRKDWVSTVFGAGVVLLDKCESVKLDEMPSYAYCRKLYPFISKDRIQNLNLNFEGSSYYGGNKQIPAIYQLHPEKNDKDKKIIELIEEELKQIEMEKELEKIIYLVKSSKNLILTGAPGTGKTYLAKQIASQMIFGEIKDIGKLSDAEKQRWKEQFKLVQFHPAYSYEDFVRGIVVNTENDMPEYKTVNKILGEFAKKANESNESGGTDDFQRAWEELVTDINNGTVKKIGSSDVEVEINTQGNIKFKSPVATYKTTYELYKIGKTNLKYETYQRIVLAYLRDTYKLKDYNAPTVKQSDKPYILIIDEINRANLPAVLGELIYALEYRGEKVESMYATDDEGNTLLLPPNLYIIGTMNTADRSVGQIDYAIRRRFAFETLLPKILDEKDLNGKKFSKELFEQVSKLFVKEIKSAVEELERSEHLSDEFRPEDVWLGHSYFIYGDENKGEKTIEQRLKYEIKPILREYLKDGILKTSAESIINVLSV